MVHAVKCNENKNKCVLHRLRAILMREFVESIGRVRCSDRGDLWPHNPFTAECSRYPEGPTGEPLRRQRRRFAYKNSAGWPHHLPAAENVDVQVVHRLGTILAIVDHKPEAAAALLTTDFCSHTHHVPEQGAVLLGVGVPNLSEARPVLGNEEHVRGSLRVNVSERVAQVVLVHRRGRDLLGQDLVEDRRVTGITRLGRLERVEDLVHAGARADDFAACTLFCE